MKRCLIYARVSTKQQTTENQAPPLRPLAAEGLRNVVFPCGICTTLNCLESAKIRTIGDLINNPHDEGSTKKCSGG